MNKQEELYTAYLHFKEARKADIAVSTKEAVKMGVFGVLPAMILAVVLIAQDSLIFSILGYVSLATAFIIIGYIATKMLVLNPEKSKSGKEWEDTFKAYLTACGVDMNSAEFPYHHATTYMRNGGGMHTVPVVYWTKVSVNGVPTSIEVQELGGKLVVFTPDAELTPAP